MLTKYSEIESHIEQDNVSFDYKIHPGRGGESNALALLKAFGFPSEIIRDENAFAVNSAFCQD